MNQPRFRTDLVTSPVEENGNRFVDVTDPDSGRTFRFYEVEYAVATAMDGSRDVASLVAWAGEELGLEPSTAEVETVISTLDALGYLGGGQAKDAVTMAADPSSLDISDLSLGAPGKSPIRADERSRREASNIDLGSAGRSPMSGTPEATPSGGDLELGAAGGNETPPPPLTGAPPPPPPLDVPDPFGAGDGDPKRTLMGTGLSVESSRPAAPAPAEPMSRAPGQPGSRPGTGGDLSVDLGQHINIGTDDVKEAVRASRVMSVPQMPELDDEPARAPMPMAGSTPIELPSRPPPAPTHAVPAPPPVAPSSGGPSAITIALFILLLAAAGGAAYYFFIYAADGKAESKKETPTSLGKSNGSGKSAGADSPKKPVGMMTKGESKTSLVRSPRDGKIEWLIDSGSEVEKDGVIAKFAGLEKLEAKVEAAEESMKRYQTKLDKATASGNKTAMQAAETNVKRKQEDVTEAQTERDAFLVKAPSPGTVTVKVENGATVALDDELASIKYETWPTANFTITEAGTYKAGDKVDVMVKSNPKQAASCEVVSYEASRLKIKCPPESDLGDNAALVLR